MRHFEGDGFAESGPERPIPCSAPVSLRHLTIRPSKSAPAARTGRSIDVIPGARVQPKPLILSCASLIWVAAACFCPRPTMAQRANLPDAMTNPFAGDASAAAAGQALYQQTCQSCHGGEARGDRGPALATGNFRHGGEDTDLFQTIRTGIAGTQMPAFATLPADNVWRIISYLRSLNTSTASTDEVVPGDAAAGKQIFFGTAAGCSVCHGVNAAGGIVGPDLSSSGTSSAEYLRAVILNPNDPAARRPRSPAPETVIVKTRGGQEVRGVKVAEDDFTLIVTDLDGTRHSFQTSDLIDRREVPASVMPSDYGQRMSPAQIQNVVAYLKSLRARDLKETIQAKLPAGLSPERLKHAEKESQNWLTYWGDYAGRHFSALQGITPVNVSRLEARWAVQIPGRSVLETTPVVVDGIMYTSGLPGQVFAIDARSGLQLWKYERRQKKLSPYETNAFNRGVAVLGERVFFGTLDAALIALDARTGLPLWETQVADTLAGYSITSAPLAVGDKIIVGIAGGEFGIRGFIDAYDAQTGKRVWRFNTVPGLGEFGNQTWRGDSWKHGSGGAWLTGSYDPDLDTLYWTVGNPGPDLNADVRDGDNLFTCSVLALDPATGTRKWHYQFTPGDSHDWDANEDVILDDLVVGGRKRKVLMQADRNGIFYVLDRTDGKFLFARPYVKQTWNSGFDASGRPLLAPGVRGGPAVHGRFRSAIRGLRQERCDRHRREDGSRAMGVPAGQKVPDGRRTRHAHRPGVCGQWGRRPDRARWGIGQVALALQDRRHHLHGTHQLRCRWRAVCGDRGWQRALHLRSAQANAIVVERILVTC